MPSVNEDALSILAWLVYVAEWSAITALLDDLSNASIVAWELDALSYERLASVTDVKFSINTSDKQTKVETDDNGTIYSAYEPTAKISGNWYETGEVNVLKTILGLNVLDVAWTPNERIYWQNINSKELPKIVIRIVGKDDADWLNNTIYLYDAWLSGDVIQSFLDVVRAGDIPASPFEFIGNRGGVWLCKSERF